MRTSRIRPQPGTDWFEAPSSRSSSPYWRGPSCASWPSDSRRAGRASGPLERRSNPPSDPPPTCPLETSA
eukprot:5899957-Pyramimonas_sp.AAC.1